jgi:hypothetical protein
MPSASLNPLGGFFRIAARLSQRLRSSINPVGELAPAITLDSACFESLSPFYLLVDSQGIALASGSSLRQLHTGALKGQLLVDLFHQVDGGERIPLNSDELDGLQGRLLRLEAKAKPGLEFAGQLLPTWGDRKRSTTDDRAGFRWILDLRPILETMEDLEFSGLSLQDLSLLDPMRVSMVTLMMDDSLRQELMDELRSMQS